MKNLSFVTFSFFTLLMMSSSSSLAKECQLYWDKAYFQDLIGTPDFNEKTQKMATYYPKYREFRGEFPVSASLNIPFKGECSGLEVRSLSFFRKIGAKEFVGEEEKSKEDHSQHGLIPHDLEFEKKPFKQAAPQMEWKKGKLVLKSFPILEYMKSVAHKKHIWALKVEVFYRNASGLDNKKTLTFEIPLIH